MPSLREQTLTGIQNTLDQAKTLLSESDYIELLEEVEAEVQDRILKFDEAPQLLKLDEPEPGEGTGTDSDMDDG